MHAEDGKVGQQGGGGGGVGGGRGRGLRKYPHGIFMHGEVSIKV